MNCFFKWIGTATLTAVLGCHSFAVGQTPADLGAGGLSPQSASMSPDLSSSDSSEGLQQRNPSGSRMRNQKITTLMESASSRTKSSLFSQNQFGALGSTASKTPLSLNNQESHPTASTASLPAFHPVAHGNFSSSRSISGPLNSLAGANSATSVPRLPRGFAVKRAHSETPLYSFLMRHQAGAKPPNSKSETSKGRPTKKTKGALVDSLLGGRNPH